MKVFKIKFAGETWNVAVRKGNYTHGNGLALSVVTINPVTGSDEPFGTLTVNVLDYILPYNFAVVKNYSENAEWAESLARQIGGKPTGQKVQTGFITCPVYDFSDIKI